MRSVKKLLHLSEHKQLLSFKELNRVLHSISSNLLTMPVVIVGYFLFAATTGIYISCPFRFITGLKCPGCGITHIVLFLLKGQVLDAFACNPVLVLYLLYLACIRMLARMCLCERFTAFQHSAGRILNWHYTHQNYMCIVMVFWGIIRNLVGV